MNVKLVDFLKPCSCATFKYRGGITEIDVFRLLEAFSQKSVEASCGCPLFKEYSICFIFNMLVYQEAVWADIMAHFECPHFKSWLKAWYRLFSHEITVYQNSEMEVMLISQTNLIRSELNPFVKLNTLFSY